MKTRPQVVLRHLSPELMAFLAAYARAARISRPMAVVRLLRLGIRTLPPDGPPAPRRPAPRRPDPTVLRVRLSASRAEELRGFARRQGLSPDALATRIVRARLRARRNAMRRAPDPARIAAARARLAQSRARQTPDERRAHAERLSQGMTAAWRRLTRAQRAAIMAARWITRKANAAYQRQERDVRLP